MRLSIFPILLFAFSTVVLCHPLSVQNANYQVAHKVHGYPPLPLLPPGVEVGTYCYRACSYI